MRVPRRLEQVHSPFQIVVRRRSLDRVFYVWLSECAYALAEIGAGSESLGFDGFGGMSTGSLRARKRFWRSHSDISDVPKMAMIVHSLRMR
jgi:hypothetical protein